MNIILAGDNSLLYSWYIRSSALIRYHVEEGEEKEQKQSHKHSQKQSHGQEAQKPMRFSYLVGIVELPLKVSSTYSVTFYRM